MTDAATPDWIDIDLDALAGLEGRIALVLPPDGTMGRAARKLNGLTRKALARLVGSEAWEGLDEGKALTIGWPAGLAADAVVVAKLAPRADAGLARKAGAAIAAARGKGALTILPGGTRRAEDLVLGVVLRDYDFADHRTKPKEPRGQITVMVRDVARVEGAAGRIAARAGGVFLTRDLVNAPANVLTTTAFAERLVALGELGLEVEVLEEDRLEALGMGALLCVGRGSVSPSKVVVMKWSGGGDAAPVALVGKGVVFDTGGISIKPAAGMEDMTMDMGGAGTVAGVMKTLAMRGARANVVGLVGIVENMPSGDAVRPGDVVTSMKGDTIEVINTDAEGRLVLADVMWFAQEEFAPVAMVDLATLTGAVIVALGHENAGVFSNDDALAGALTKAAGAEGEGAWRLPLAPAYDEKLKSRIADMKNVGGRDAGSITAAQFLKRFVQDGVAWAHLDIAGTASRKEAAGLAPAGATGWGVLTLDRWIADGYEG